MRRRHGAHSWRGVVVSKRRRLFDGANLYRTVNVEIDGDVVTNVRVPRALWRVIEPGDTLVKEPHKPPQKPGPASTA